MAYGDNSELIRQYAWERYIQPQIRSGVEAVSVSIKPLMKDLEARGFPKNHPRQFCTALQKTSFLEEKGLVLDRVEGPPSGTSTTVVLHYKVNGNDPASRPDAVVPESPSERAYRLTEKLRGLMKDEIAVHGGGAAYLRWVRGEDDDEAA